MSTRFTVLGPVEVLAAGRGLTGLAPRHRAVLAYLLLHAGTVVSAERLIGAVWGEEPPDTARAQIHAAVTAIRRVLREARAAQLLASRAGGYVISPGPGQFDLAEFTSQTTAAQEQAEAGDAQGAVEHIRSALALWRGQPLADVTAGYVSGARARLEGRRLAAFERLAELELSIGGRHDLIDELAVEVAEHPVRERLSCQLMLALYRAGRHADALAAGRAFRAALTEQQGLDPSRAFAGLEQAILRNDPSLDRHWPPAIGPEDGGRSADGRQREGGTPAGEAEQVREPRRRVNFLPYDIPDFAGRAAELSQLALPGPGPGATIWVIDGMAGIGKTALAVHAAHRLASRFPDGQIFADLQAHTPGREPVEPGTALEILLRQLGVPVERIPGSVTDRAALWRAELSDRRVLAVLDNVTDTGHVRPLLPGVSDSVLLITSRRRLTGIDGAQVLSVDLLPAEDSVSLFSRIAGGRADDEPLAVLDVLHQCGFLPLAIRIAVARLQHRPQWTVSYLADRLRDQRRRLTELTAEDRSVAAAFTVSYQQLDPRRQRMFRLLGLHPGRDFEARAAAALADIAPAQAEALLEDLLDAHMLLQHEPGRYTFHDLLREHARATASAQETATTRRDALTRLLDRYAQAAATAINLLYPYGDRYRARLSELAAPAASFGGAAEAARWLDAERANLIAAGIHAADHDWPVHASQLAGTLFPYLYDYGHHTAVLTLHTHALRASQRRGDKSSEGSTLEALGWVCMRLGRYEEASEHSREALRICRESGDRAGEAGALNTLGGLCVRQQDYAQAHQHLQRALDLYQEIGDQVGETHVLDTLGVAYERQGRYEQAREHLQRTLNVLCELGCGEPCLEEAITRTHLGVVCQRQGQHEEALSHHRHALDVFRELGNRSEEAAARNGLGETAQAMGDPARAVIDYDVALALAREAGNRLEQARAHDGMARAHHELGHSRLAREHASQALKLHANLGLPDAAETSRFLKGNHQHRHLDDPPQPLTTRP
jgi:DNA-binding SARP family transcriptional activator/tetratricopeptide (TPR) repeat protein